MIEGIQVEKLTKKYPGKARPALSEVDLNISAGEVFGLVGPNGAGKTTFLCCLLGLLRPESGQILIDGMDIDDLRVKRKIGYVPERLQFDTWMTGEDLMELHHGLAGKPAAGRKAEARRRLTEVHLETEAWTRPIRTYSRGMLQRVALAQALIGDPQYLFLDEPTSGMDPSGAMQVRDLLLEMRQRGMTVVLNSHQLDQVEKVCDRVAFLKDGVVQSIEVSKAGEETAHVFQVRWLGEAPGKVLSACAEGSGAQLLETRENGARFKVKGDEMAADLLAQLSLKKVRLIQAAPEHGRLERLFLSEDEQEGAK
jgi:ABC-2 type transport system ATP-binding protein